MHRLEIHSLLKLPEQYEQVTWCKSGRKDRISYEYRQYRILMEQIIKQIPAAPEPIQPIQQQTSLRPDIIAALNLIPLHNGKYHNPHIL